MDLTKNPLTDLQWKWVWLSLGFYAAFYLLPLTIILGLEAIPLSMTKYVGGAWVFGGIVIVAALAAYVSPGVTIWEPAVASAALALLLFILRVFITTERATMLTEAIIPIFAVFALALLGAWIGEKAQGGARREPS